jgi:hypothetical protein
MHFLFRQTYKKKLNGQRKWPEGTPGMKKGHTLGVTFFPEGFIGFS